MYCLQLIRKFIHIMILFFLSRPTLRATFGVSKLSTIVFMSLTCSHIEGSRLVDFTDFSVHFVFIFVGMGQIEVISRNGISQTLIFKVILSHTFSCENLLNNALTSSLKVKSPQESPRSFELWMNNNFKCTWMDFKGMEPYTLINLASSQAHGRLWVTLSVQPQVELSVPTLSTCFNSWKMMSCASLDTKLCNFFIY